MADENPARRNKQTAGQGRTSDYPRLLGGWLCLDFVNTIEGPRTDHPEDFLHSYADLAQWAWHAGALSRGRVRELLTVARARPQEAEAVFARAVALRAALQGVFRAIARSEPLRDPDLDRVHAEYTAALAAAGLARTERAFDWSWERSPQDLMTPVWLVAESGARLLTEGDLRRIKECPGADDCGWLFYDVSRNGTRRWCSMEGCGSRVKMRRHYQRARGDRPREPGGQRGQ